MDRVYQYHFTPPKGWINDPNGLVYINGVYHLFYQHYPNDIVWGPMHWGHAVSTDLLHWEHKQIAIFPTGEEYIFSGSCIYDKENVSGLGTKECPPLVAFYTAHNPVTGEEQQSVAYSTDYETFTKYEGNPIIQNRKYVHADEMSAESGKEVTENPGYKKDFRDPKVFPNPIKGGFSMVLAAGHQLEFYHSVNLLSWEKTGVFALKEGFTEICECPDCFPMETEEGTKWILTLSLTSHVMPYYVGVFNGDTFVETEGAVREEAEQGSGTEIKQLLLDYASDNYAMVSFANAPVPLLLGWGESWDYVSQTPAENYRGKMTMPRKTELVKTTDGWRLKFALAVTKGIAKQDFWSGMLRPGEQKEFLFEEGKKLVLFVTENEVLVDRSQAGEFSFSEFLQKEAVCFKAERVMSGDCKVTVIQDNGYFEIFAEDGFIVFSVMTY